MERRAPAERFRAFDLVVVAGSLGGIDASSALVAALPASFELPIALVLHRRPGALAEVLERRMRRPVIEPLAELTLTDGVVYLAPAERHLVVTSGAGVASFAGERVNRFCPSADVLFTSAARVHGPRVLAVVLGGLLYDGAAGARAIRRAGGVVIAQSDAADRRESMPRATVEAGAASYALPLADIASALVTLATVEGALSLFPADASLDLERFALSRAG